MTVLEATNRLVQFFARNNFFEMETDFTKIMPVFDSDAYKASILIALENLERQQLIARKKVEETEFWVLIKPLALQEQNVQISLLTAISVAETINAFIANEQDHVNPMEISEKDIANLVALAKRG